jgi:hypothetical protein
MNPKTKKTLIYTGVSIAFLFVVAASPLKTVSNCGGNSAALSYSRSLSLSILSQIEENQITGKGSYPFDAEVFFKSPEIKKSIAHNFSWGVKSYWIKKTIHLNEGKPIIVCGQYFSNVPRPSIFNFFQTNPSFAACYIDKQFLLTLSEYNEIDFREYVYIHENDYKVK